MPFAPSSFLSSRRATQYQRLASAEPLDYDDGNSDDNDNNGGRTFAMSSLTMAPDSGGAKQPASPTLESAPASANETTDWGNTSDDVRDMLRLGKRQEFRRNFGFLSTLGFVSIYMATWEFVLVSLSAGFANGGFAGLFWCFITTVVCYASVVASLAEMASMAPTAGGQYHWVAEFAPPSGQKWLSYASGWMATLGWVASVASSVYVVAYQVESLVQVYSPDFAFEAWHITLIMIALSLVTIVFNTWGAAVLPAVETASLVAHLAGFFVFLIPLLVLCPKNDAYDVFLNFQSSGGYNMGTAYLVSQVTILFCSLGSDSVVHIAEEVEDASLVVPRAMWWSFVGNIGLGFIMLIAMLFCIGPLDAVNEAYSPYLLLFNNTGSPALSLVLNLILFFLIFAGNITALASCSREMFAFARDKGLPFPSVIGKMDNKKNVPTNSVYITSALVAILALIQLGSDVAFNILVSLSVLGLLSTYMISIGCVLLKRLRGEPLPPARWSLGHRGGIVVNSFGFFYSFFIIVFSCFPTELPVDVASANWSPLIWFAAIVVAAGVYVVHGRKNYVSPVEFVEGRKLAGTELQSS